MAVRIRLARRGKKKKPFYWIVAASSEAPRDGRFIEKLGIYNPLTNPSRVEIRHERLQHWLDQGAEPTVTVRNLIDKHHAQAESTPAM
jgi:small subunit ribosomal protein S16